MLPQERAEKALDSTVRRPVRKWIALRPDTHGALQRNCQTQRISTGCHVLQRVASRLVRRCSVGSSSGIPASTNFIRQNSTTNKTMGARRSRTARFSPGGGGWGLGVMGNSLWENLPRCWFGKDAACAVGHARRERRVLQKAVGWAESSRPTKVSVRLGRSRWASKTRPTLQLQQAENVTPSKDKGGTGATGGT